MNVTILTNQTQYPYHSPIAYLIQNLLNKPNYTLSILDINSEKYDHLCLKKLKELSPQILITLDLAGFNFRTQAGENALNMLTTKNLNLVWGNKAEYSSLLLKKISLSMLFYDATGKDNCFLQQYPNLQYYKTSGQFYIDTTAKTNMDNEKAFLYIWEDFKKEALLSGA